MVDYSDFELQFIEIKDVVTCKIGYKESFREEEKDDDGVTRESFRTEECTRVKLFGEQSGLTKALKELSELVPTRVDEYKIIRLDVHDHKDWFYKLKIKFSYRMQGSNEITSSTKDINIQETFSDIFSDTVDEVNTALERVKVVAYMLLYDKDPAHLINDGRVAIESPKPSTSF